MRLLTFLIAALLTSCAHQPTKLVKSPLFYESEGYQTHLKAQIDRTQQIISLHASITNTTTRPLTIISHPHFYTLSIASTALTSKPSQPSSSSAGSPAKSSDVITLRPGESHRFSREFPYHTSPEGITEIKGDDKTKINATHHYLIAYFRYEMFAEHLPSPLPPRANYQVAPLSAEILFPLPE